MTSASSAEPSLDLDDNPLASGRIPSLDGLRAVAILLVLLTHVCLTYGFRDNPILGRFDFRRTVGVDVFFVISGFLITTLMLREIARNGRLSIRQFYYRRALRIIPAYLAFLFALFLIGLAGHGDLSKTDWLAALTYTVNFVPDPAWTVGHVWSLSIEEHFYLIWPLIVALGGLAGARRGALSLIAFCFVLRWIILLAFPDWSSMTDWWTFTRLDSISYGCLLAVVCWNQSSRNWLTRTCKNNGLLLVIFVLLVLSVGVLHHSGKYRAGIAHTADGVAIVVLLWAAVTRPQSLFGRILNHPLLVTLGVGSYSLYLWQQIFLNPYGQSFINRFPQNLLFAGMAAVCSHLIVERPFLRLKNRSSAAVQGTTLPSPALAGQHSRHE